MDKILTYNIVTQTATFNVTGAKINAFMVSLDKNNTFVPGIERVIYNLGKKAYPKRDADGHKIKDENGKLVMAEPVDVLTTVVFFKDHTKVVVTNSEHDGIELEEVSVNKADPNAPKVKVATEHSKEIGLMYAMVKRIIGMPDQNGTIKPNGFINRIQNIVTNAADSKLDSATRAYNEKRTKEATKQKAPAPKADSDAVKSADDFVKAAKNLAELAQQFVK